MNLTSHLTQRLLRLPPPRTRDLVIERDRRVPMPDGIHLLADRWAPRAGGESLPTALIRSPYGRRGAFAAAMARPLAERGFQVLIQSTRGTFGSGGAFDPMRCERDDGLATLEWVVKQPWFGGTIVLTGPSYLGYVQWAVADRMPPEVKAMIPQVTESALTLEFLRPDGLSLETPFGWGVMVAGQERRMAFLRQGLQAPQDSASPADPPAEPGGQSRDRPPLGLHPGHHRLRRECAALGGDRPPAPGRQRHRAGQLDRRLV